MSNKSLTAVLLFMCPDRPGLVSTISHFIFELGGNILDLDEHVETDEKFFSMRIAWEMNNESITKSDIIKQFKTLGDEFNADWKINFKDRKKEWQSSYQNTIIVFRKYYGDTALVNTTLIYLL